MNKIVAPSTRFHPLARHKRPRHKRDTGCLVLDQILEKSYNFSEIYSPPTLEAFTSFATFATRKSGTCTQKTGRTDLSTSRDVDQEQRRKTAKQETASRESMLIKRWKTANCEMKDESRTSDQPPTQSRSGRSWNRKLFCYLSISFLSVDIVISLFLLFTFSVYGRHFWDAAEMPKKKKKPGPLSRSGAENGSVITS